MAKVSRWRWARRAGSFSLCGVPEHIRSNNGLEFTAKAILKWLDALDVKPLFIEPGSPWESGTIESFHGELRDELLNGDISIRCWKQKP